MPDNQKHTGPARTQMIGVRVDMEQKKLVEAAADREGLQISSFILMILVRLHILPESSLQKIKRRPVPFFNALHELLGVVNKVGGNCKQLAAAMPDTDGLYHAHLCIIQAAEAITDALQGKSLATDTNLYGLQAELVKQGHLFNEIVRSVNMGKPNLARLPDTLAAIADAANAIIAAMSHKPLDEDAILELAMEEMRQNMRKAEEQAARGGDA